MQGTRLSFMGAIEYEHRLWFYDNGLNALCSLDTKKQTLNFEKFCEEPKAVGAIFERNKKFYMFSQNEFSVRIYDTIDRSLCEIIWNDDDIPWVDPKIMSLHAKIDDKVYLVPVGAKCENENLILSYFDLDEECFHTYNVQPQNEGIKESVYWFSYPSATSAKIYAGYSSNSQYICVDFQSGKYALTNLFEQGVIPYSVCFDGENLWMTQLENSDIYRIEKNGTQTRFPVNTVNHQPYSRILNLSEHIIALPRFSDIIVLIDKASMKADFLPIRSLLSSTVSDECSKSYSCNENDSSIFVHPLGMERILRIDKKGMTVEALTVERNMESVYRRFSEIHKCWGEDSDLLTLDNYIKALLSNAINGAESKTKQESYGKSIYSTVAEGLV